MSPQQFTRRKIARDIIIHILIHKYLPHTGIAENAEKAASILEQSGVIKMEADGMGYVIADKQRAEFLVHG